MCASMTAIGLEAVLVALVYLTSEIAANEIAFVNVASDDTFDVHALDVPVAAAKGFDNFFAEDPMVSHDWAHVRTVNRSVRAQLTSVGQSSTAADRLRRLEDKLRPLYAALPKNEHGRLANGTAHYALHRFFTREHGWSMKGLEPAGGSWLATETVGPDVKQVNKYIVPTYVQELLVRHSGGRGLDLSLLAVFVASLEHLVHAEMIHLLYSVYATLEKPTVGEKSDAEVDEILTGFLTVYAFGVNLEVSTRRDVLSAKRYLDAHHSDWRELQEIVRESRAKVEAAAVESGGRDFAGLLRVAEEMAERYGPWQRRDCVRAKEQLVAWSRAADGAVARPGRVPLANVVPMRAEGYRSLFADNVDYMWKLGVLDESPAAAATEGVATAATTEAAAHVIVPNYVTSQAMCLSTASFYTVCCPNECEALMAQFERDQPTDRGLPLEVVTRLTAAFRASLGGASELSADLEGELQRLAGEHGGAVPLYGREFANWLHHALPNECPAPSVFQNTNPRTADEWMADPGSGADTEDMMNEIADTLARYTAMGSEDGSAPAADDEPLPGDEEPDVVKLKERPPSFEASITMLRQLGPLLKLASALSVMALVVRGIIAAYASGLTAMGGDTKKAAAWQEYLA